MTALAQRICRTLSTLPPSCFLVGVWVATGLTGGLVLAPRLTRLVATALTAVAASDFLQMAYATAQQAAEGGHDD